MSHRIGECSSCGAKYKLPASFSAARARCKQCDGVVEIGPVVQAEPAPAAPEPVEVKKKEREGPSMKERLLSQRQARAAPPQPVPARRPAPKVAAPKAAASKPAGRPQPKREEKPSAKQSVRSSRSAAPAKSRRDAAQRRDEDEDDGGRKGRGSAHRGAHGRRQQKKSPMVPFLLAIVAFAFVGAGSWYLLDLAKEEGEGQSPGSPAVADAGQTPESGAMEPDEGTAEEAGPAGTAPEETAPEESTPEETASEPEAKAPKPTPGDPDSIDLSVFPDYGPIEGCSEERFLELKQLAADMVDPLSGAAGTRARIKLEEAGKEAFPVIVNVMKKLDLSTDDGFRAGDMCQKTLETICNGMNAGWWYPDQNPDDYVFKSKQAIKLWCTTWERVKDDEDKWLVLTKQKKPGEEAPEEKPKEKTASEDDLDELDGL